MLKKIFFMLVVYGFAILPKSFAQSELDFTNYDNSNLDAFILQQQELLKNNQNGHVYYNLGNAYYRQGKIGHAIAAYLHAKQLLPRDADVKENLRFVHGKIKDKLTYDFNNSLFTAMFFWQSFITTKELYISSCILLGIAFLILIGFMLTKNKLLQQFSYVCFILGFFTLFVFTFDLLFHEKWGSVVNAEVRVFSGPAENNTVIFKLREGAPFIVSRQDSSWYQINLSDGKKGWVSQKDVMVY